VTKVNINSSTHQVEVEHDGPLDDVIAATRKLWNDTIGSRDGFAGPALGFQAERRGTPGLYPMDIDGK
jgi:hypothetical protein